MTNYKIVGIAIKDRIKEAQKTQAILTKHACIIKSRLGFHEVSEYTCSRVGFIILQIIDDKERYSLFLADLKTIEGIEVQEMNFSI
ncbi:MAG: hypothetical protein ACUVQP_02735 [Bacteroidales bacterium]